MYMFQACAVSMYFSLVPISGSSAITQQQLGYCGLLRWRCVFFVVRRDRFAGTALLGEMRVSGHAEVSYNRRFRIQNLQHRSIFFSSYHKDMANRYFVVQAMVHQSISAMMQRGVVAPLS